MKKEILLMLLLTTTALHLLTGCGGRQSAQTSQPLKDTTIHTSFPFPDIPPIIASPEERATYLLLHYWEKFDFSDTLLLQEAAITEQGIVDYLSLLSECPDEQTVEESIRELCAQASPYTTSAKIIPGLMEKYLYEANSPQRNEALFAYFLHCLSEQPALQNAPARTRWLFLQNLIEQNNPGSPANNFTFYTPDGRKKSLYNMPDNYLLLFFYDPECSNCQQVLTEMKSNRQLAHAAAEKAITILAVYTETDEDTWLGSLHEIPAEWVVGTDKGSIQEKASYDLKAMPSLYLLDADKKVVLKDATFTDICSTLGLLPI